MIISHKFKVIFIKLKKVSGTSFEIAFSKYCDSGDVVTTIEEEEKRISLGYKARNYRYFMTKLWLTKLKMFTGIPKYRNFKTSLSHLGAKEIEQIIGADIWNNYLKIAIIRSPYEKAISYYFWKKRKEKPTIVKDDFEEFVSLIYHRRKNNPLLDYDLVHIKGKSVVDFIVRYEHSAEDIENLENRIMCPGLLKTYRDIHVKDTRPKKGTSIYEVYSKYPKAKLLIDLIHYENFNKYELLRDYWPTYKLETDNILQGSFQEWVQNTIHPTN